MVRVGDEYTPLTAADLSEWLGEPIVEEEDVSRAGVLIQYAWTLVNAETNRDMVHWLDSGVPRDVELVVLQVASRGYTNPDSWGNERVDDWGAGGRPISELGMSLQPAEKSVLAKWGERKLRGIGVVKTTRAPHHHDYRVVHTGDGASIVWYG